MSDNASTHLTYGTVGTVFVIDGHDEGGFLRREETGAETRVLAFTQEAAAQQRIDEMHRESSAAGLPARELKIVQTTTTELFEKFGFTYGTVDGTIQRLR